HMDGFKFANLEASVVAFEGSINKRKISQWREWIDEKLGGGSGGGGSYQPSIIIAGPQNSGKTSLLTLLTTDSVRPTVVSQEPLSAADYDGSGVTLVDFPGHVKLRYKLSDYLKTRAKFVKGLIFMVDSTVDPKKLTTTAEFLVDILSITESSCENGIDILIACNKSELFTARPPSKIKDALESEIQKVIERRK
uniref:Signal recognition particle receptor beta subunit n=1 Tax=Saccharomyces cerevisiae TaxID=4932 RepID=UPI0000D5BE60|nr:Chain A, Signal recognition particle receptor beta subunit [Saccharomyces cerevisiae]2GED_B Chain B, Signal recognition particle receptor beta subunit [Saccharomyces cerevisiae]